MTERQALVADAYAPCTGPKWFHRNFARVMCPTVHRVTDLATLLVDGCAGCHARAMVAILRARRAAQAEY